MPTSSSYSSDLNSTPVFQELINKDNKNYTTMKNLKNPIRILFLAAICLLANQSFAQRSTIFGKWKTIDDESGKKRSIVKIEERDGKAYGTILELFREPDERQDPICVEC